MPSSPFSLETCPLRHLDSSVIVEVFCLVRSRFVIVSHPTRGNFFGDLTTHECAKSKVAQKSFLSSFLFRNKAGLNIMKVEGKGYEP